MSHFRIERDTMGEMQVPIDALHGASTARAVENFPVALEPMADAVIHAFGYLKAACARANWELGKLDEKLAKAIIAASEEVAAGRHNAHFPVDIYQTGSGTSTNTNANEVIANLANQMLGHGIGAKGKEGAVHPNDHVNMGQSSNDTFPTAMHIAATMAIARDLIPALQRLHADLDAKAKEWDKIVKIGRTHLMDATPIRVGQVFSGYAAQAHYATVRASRALKRLEENMPIGGTAVGTGINTHPKFAAKVCVALSNQLGLTFTEAANHPEAQAAKDSFVEAHGELKTIAVSISKIANDIRLLGSGPRCSIFELSLPATQPGSSIMPGKVNPVIAEAAMQVVCRVIGNDATVTTAGSRRHRLLVRTERRHAGHDRRLPRIGEAALERFQCDGRKTVDWPRSERRALPRFDRPVADDGHLARTQDWLRKSGRTCEGCIQQRQDNSRPLPRAKSAARCRAR